MDLGDRHRLRERNHKGVREDGVGDTGVGELLVDFAQRGELQSIGCGCKRNVGLVKLAHHFGHWQALAVQFTQTCATELAAVAGVQRFINEESVQERRMCWVNAHLKGLQPVAVPQAFEGKSVGIRGGEAVKGRKRWGLRAFGAKPAKQHTAALHQRIATLLDLLAQGAAGGFGGCVSAKPFGVEFPAVKRAAQSVTFIATKRQVGAPVRAIAVQQAKLAAGVFEQNKVLPQHAHGLHGANAHVRVKRRIEFIDQRHRLPVTAHQVAAGRARTDAGNEFVEFCFHVCLLVVENGIP